MQGADAESLDLRGLFKIEGEKERRGAERGAERGARRWARRWAKRGCVLQ